MALFIGGSRDGQTMEVTRTARFMCVAVALDQVSTGEEFKRINLDHVWNGRPPPPCRHEFYKRTGRDGDTVIYTLDRVEDPAPPTTPR